MSKERRLFNRFKTDRSGNMAIMTAIVLVVLLGAIGAATDMMIGAKARSDMADASDAISLIIAKSDAETQADMRNIAQTYLDTKFNGKNTHRLGIESITRDGDAVTVVLKNNIDSVFSNVMGRRSNNVGTASTAIYTQGAAEIVMVLDTTGSMSGSKISSLKSSASSLIDTIASFDNPDVQVGIVPFSNYVNVGTSRRNEPWLNVDPDTSTTTHQCRTYRPVTSRSNCRTEQRTCTNDGVSRPCDRTVCDQTYGPEQTSCGPQTHNRRWKGCVGSRNTPLDERAAYAGSKIPGLMNRNCATELLPLTNTLTQVKSKINSMSVGGETYMPAGIVWGWRLLDNNAPFDHNSLDKVQKVMIIMTDGQNTKSKDGQTHDAGNSADADRKTRSLCTAVKREEIVVYTIAYEVTDSVTRGMLEDCASANDYFFNATNASQLQKAFQDIGHSLTKLRISA